MTTSRQWLDAYARKAGVDGVSDEELATVLDLAAVAAHASERQAAPVTCWMAAKAGLSLQEALTLAEQLATEQG